jgi:TRAP-type C4-dicarboxylate transport system substrate-binding protein
METFMSIQLQRRQFVAQGTALGAAAFAGNAWSQNKVILTYSDIVPENDSRTAMLRNAFSALGSDIEFKSHHGGTLYKQGTEPVAIQRGNLDMANIASGDVQNQVELAHGALPYSRRGPLAKTVGERRRR